MFYRLSPVMPNLSTVPSLIASICVAGFIYMYAYTREYVYEFGTGLSIYHSSIPLHVNHGENILIFFAIYIPCLIFISKAFRGWKLCLSNLWG